MPGGMFVTIRTRLFRCRHLAGAALLAVCSVVASTTVSHAASHTAGRTHAPNLVPPGWPKSLSIPRIGVRAPVEDITLKRPGDAHAPYKWGDTGWYSPGRRPGQAGRAVMFGHLDSTTGPAVFWHLNSLVPGDQIDVGYGTRPVVFRVVWTHVYSNTQLPVRWMYTGRRGQRGLILFTCAGIFHTDGTGYDHKFMVYARMVLPNGRLG